ncbi:MAG TPA: helix-turn-helix domain-containing protein [Candidatus Borkfalkia excrementigallinarum]|uniref:Helix-turn-helix domain-containing protein n=1 Tax=Candidatus Borkfalkia excrementigallinarum TaxID=2838506 RepID=A0A9D1ZWB3_9FIRM|nr:helix-turn-helix domain-containing protein [Candidatus Borkfalkia excrementigallinarum]
MKIFGERLRDLRSGRGLTQKQFAAVLNVSGNTVHCWETDKQEPSMAMLLVISDYFGVSLDYLLGRSDY